MKILAIECSAVPASCAVMENGKIIASSFVNVRLTHSQTLLPMAVATMNSAGINCNEIDGFAVSHGPGSFTGIRIGISAVKGLAAPKNTPCVGVSALESMAYNFIDTNCIVCAVMDARCNQVYNALFRVKNGNIERLVPDRALMCEELAEELKQIKEKIIIVGDGTEVFAPFAENNESVVLSHPTRRYQSAVGVALLAEKAFKNNETVTPDKLLPLYLRLPQAERELAAKQNNKK